MDTRSFDALTRRASLMTLGTAGLATLAGLAHPLATVAKKKKRKNRNKNKGDVNKLCKSQVGICRTFIAPSCEENPNCSEIVDCCSFFGTCNVTGFFDCFVEASQIPETEARLFR